MRKTITIIVGIIIVCGIGGFAISSRSKETDVNKLLASNKETKVNKVVDSNKISPEEESLKNVKSDNEKNINTNINEETSNQQSINIKNTKPITNQKDVQTGENIKVINNQNTNKIVKQSNQENNDIKNSNNNSTNSKYQISGRALDNLINNLYVSSWHQIRAIDKSFDKNGTEGGQLFDLIQLAVSRLTYGESNLSKTNLKAEVIKTSNNNNNSIVYINLGELNSKLKGYYDEIKSI